MAATPRTFVGNSLGLQPVAARAIIEQELDDWAQLGVEGHFDAARPWYPYHENLRDGFAHVVGALPSEVVAMNSLTVNLHLLMVSFHRPEGDRRILLMEDGAFPSDTYAVQSHIAARGGDPGTDIVRVRPEPGEDLLRTEDILAEIERLGDRLATVMLGGVNFRTGQLLDLAAITEAAHAAGAIAGFDLAHAAGNVPLALHDWNVDFAAWCTYKYLNGGPGAVGGAFIHERHATNGDIPRFAGWWGNDPDTRFRMHLEDTFVPVPTAEAWQLSNPPILAMAPLVASLDLFMEAGLPALRSKSRVLTGFPPHLPPRDAPRRELGDHPRKRRRTRVPVVGPHRGSRPRTIRGPRATRDLRRLPTPRRRSDSRPSLSTTPSPTAFASPKFFGRSDSPPS